MSTNLPSGSGVTGNRKTPQAVKADERYAALRAQAEKLGRLPFAPPGVVLETATANAFAARKTSELTLPCGFYLCVGGTGGGKSTTAASLAAAALRKGYSTALMYVYEARGPELPDAAGFYDNVHTLVTGEDLRTKDDQAAAASISVAMQGLVPAQLAANTGTASFFDEVKKAYKASAVRRVSGQKAPALEERARMLVVDSISLPLRAYGPWDQENEGHSRKGEATMPLGMQPSDIAFVTKMEALAVAARLVIIGTVNEDLVPFSDKLEAMSEGIIQSQGPGYFYVRTRSERTMRQVALCNEDIDVGAAFLDYRTLTEASKGASFSEIILA